MTNDTKKITCDPPNDTDRYHAEIGEALSEVAQANLHPAEEIHRWMRSWGTDNELQTPKTPTDETLAAIHQVRDRDFRETAPRYRSASELLEGLED